MISKRNDGVSQADWDKWEAEAFAATACIPLWRGDWRVYAGKRAFVPLIVSRMRE